MWIMEQNNRSESILIYGQNIKKIRERINLDIRELAEKVDYDRNDLSRLEYGEKNISYKTAVKLAKNLNVPFPLLFSRNFVVNDKEGFCEDEFLMIYIENIKRELKARGMTQAHIYVECEIHESTVSRLLTGKNSNPRINTLALIASAVTDGDLKKLFSRSCEKNKEVVI